MAIKKPELTVVPRPILDCAYDGCRMGAFVKVRTKTGWANLCISHYERQNQGDAKAYAEQNALSTPQAHLTHIKAMLRKPKNHSPKAHWERVQTESRSVIAKVYAEERLRKYTTREREPGQDDEEIDYSKEPMLNV